MTIASRLNLECGKGVAEVDFITAQYTCAGPEVWRQTHGRVTHFVSSMGTTGTIMGVSRYLKEQNPDVTIVGLQPAQGASIAGTFAADNAAFANASRAPGSRTHCWCQAPSLTRTALRGSF